MALTTSTSGPEGVAGGANMFGRPPWTTPGDLADAAPASITISNATARIDLFIEFLSQIIELHAQGGYQSLLRFVDLRAVDNNRFGHRKQTYPVPKIEKKQGHKIGIPGIVAI